MNTSTSHLANAAAAIRPKWINLLFAAIVLCAALVPASALVFRPLANAAFAFLLLIGLVAACFTRFRNKLQLPFQSLRNITPWAVVLALALLTIVLGLNQIFANHSLPYVHFIYTRFSLFILILIALLLVPSHYLAKAYWGVLIGAVLAAALSYISTRAGRPSQIVAMNPIPYGNLCVLLGFLSLLCLRDLNRNDEGPLKITFATLACIVAAICGLLGSIWTESRGGWVALIVIALLFICAAPGIKAMHKIIAMIVFSVVLVLSYTQIDRIHSRVTEAVDQSMLYLNQGNRDTSVGIRLQLWEASLVVLKEHPLAGVGVGHYQEALKSLSDRGVISPLAATMPHSHNELAYFATLLGIPGLLCILCIYFIPAGWFLSKLRSRQERTRIAAYMGLTTCLLFFVFGWTEVMFVIAATNVLYVTFLALFAAVVIRSELELAKQ
jgi:O-antigen ligase